MTFYVFIFSQRYKSNLDSMQFPIPCVTLLLSLLARNNDSLVNK